MRHNKPQPEPARTVSTLKAQPHPLAYCVEDAAKALGIGRTFVFKLIKEGQLLAVKIGRRTVIPVREVEAFLARLSAGCNVSHETQGGVSGCSGTITCPAVQAVHALKELNQMNAMERMSECSATAFLAY